MGKARTQEDYDRQYKDWELSIEPIEDWAKEEGVLEQDKPPIRLVKVVQPVDIEAILSQVDSENQPLSNTRFAGHNRDLTTLLSGLDVLEEELRKYNIYTLTDSRKLEQYEALVREVVDVLEGVKQHYIDFTNHLVGLEEDNFQKLEKRQSGIKGELKKFEDQKGVYQQVKRALDSDASYERLVRAESQLYASLVESQKRVGSMTKSYEADRSVNRVLNVACANGRIAVENLTQLQRTLLDNLGMQVSALGMGTMVQTMQETDLGSILETGWNVIEYFHKTVSNMKPAFDTDRIYDSISAMSERAQEIDKSYRSKFGNGDLTK